MDTISTMKHKARFSQLNNDLFWEFITPSVFNDDSTKIIGGIEILRWSGYNDNNWWNKWSKEKGKNIRTDKLGQVWIINYVTNEVKLITKPAGILL